MNRLMFSFVSENYDGVSADYDGVVQNLELIPLEHEIAYDLAYLSGADDCSTKSTY